MSCLEKTFAHGAITDVKQQQRGKQLLAIRMLKRLNSPFPVTAAFLISVPAPPNTPTCRIIVLFFKISCHVCSFKAGGQLVAFPFAVLRNLGVFSFFLWIGWLKDPLPSQQVPGGSCGTSAHGPSSGGCPEAGQAANGWKLLVLL